jgi:hypothetical protein
VAGFRLHRLLPVSLVAVAGALLGAGLAAAEAARPVAQVTGPCRVQVNGVDVNEASRFTDAVDVSVEEDLVIAGISAEGAPELEIAVELGPARWVVVEAPGSGSGELWGARIDVADHARYGVGLYRVVATHGSCIASVYVDVTGRSPLRTVAGASAAGLLAAGLMIQGFAFVRAARGRGGRWSAVFGGIPTGVGALVLSQQFGVAPLESQWVVTWIVGPSAVGGIARAGLARRPGARAPAPDTAGGPPPAEGAGGTRDVLPPTELPAEEGEPAGSSTDRRDPPRTAFALLDCKEAVLVGEEFDLTVGLASRATAGVAGPALVRPQASVGPYTLGVQLVADGFSIRAGESLRHDLPVTYDRPYPRVGIHLIPQPRGEDERWRAIRAIYSVEGQTIGMAERIVAVAGSHDVLDRLRRPAAPAGLTMVVPTGETAPDLSVRVVFAGVESGGRLRWTLDSPYEEIARSLSPEPMETDIGGHPAAFALRVVQGVGEREGRRRVFEYVRGLGETIAEQMPDAFWDVLRRVAAAAAPRVPSVLLLSAEPYVPWELAVVDPPLDADAPPFLAAQTDMGRWVLGRRRPPLPPPTEVAVDAMAVISGVYGEGWQRLPEAEMEADELSRAYGAAMVRARVDDVLDCIEGNPRADVLHFAVHGTYEPGSGREGLVLTDGAILDPLEVRGSRPASSPFVFLNACQIGSGNEILGDYAGMAEAFLHAGAAGVVAPLWSVGDGAARDIALRFYQRVLAGATPAEVLRTERARFTDSPQTVSATYLAYQLFGHPAMRLTRAPAGPAPGAPPR